MKFQLHLFVVVAMTSLLASCSGSQNQNQYSNSNSSSGGPGGQNNPAGQNIATAAELDKMRDFVNNSSMPLQAKSKLMSTYISALAQKYNVSRNSISQQVADYFQVQKDSSQGEDFSAKGLSKLTSAVSAVRSQVALENGAALTGNGTESMNLLAQTQAINVLRTSNLQEKLLSAQELRKEQIHQTQVLFQAIDTEAQKDADAIAATVAQAKLQDPSEQKTIASWKEIATDAEKTKAVMAGAQLADNVGKQLGFSDAQKKAMIPYLANSVLKYGLGANLNKDSGKSTLTVSLADPKIRDAAGNLSKACDALAKFATSRKDSLNGIGQALSDFSKNGTVKVDVSGFINVDDLKKLQDSAAKIDSKVTEYTNDAQTLVDVAGKIGVDPKILKIAADGIKAAHTAQSVLSAFVSPSPASIMNAVGSVFGGLGLGGPSADEIMNAKLDSILNMQQEELNQLEDIKQGISAVQQELGQVETLIGEVSKQIADSSQVLYNQMINIESGIQQLAQMEQRTERELTGATDCDTLASALSQQKDSSGRGAGSFQLRSSLFSSDIDPYLAGCFRFVSLINPPVTDTSSQFLDIGHIADGNATGKEYAQVLQLTNLANNTDVNLPLIALNPLENFFDISKIYASGSTVQITGSLAATNALQNIAAYYQGQDELFDSLKVARYADLVTTVSPLVNLYQRYQDPSEEPGANVASILDSMMQPESSYQEWLSHLMELVNINIAQQVLMSGVSVANTDIKTLLALNSTATSKIDCGTTIDPLYCLLSQNQDVRENILNYDLIRDLKNQQLGTIGYDYLTNLPHSSDTDLSSMLALIQSAFTSPWPLSPSKLPDGSSWISTQIANQSVPLPSGIDLSQGVIKYKPELNLLLATRENLLDLMTEMRLGDITDPVVKDQIFKQALKRAL
jgi:hypothetical protein